MSTTQECRGSCLCGAVNLTVTLADHKVDACHCNMCRKWGGGPFLSAQANEQVRIDGEESVTIYSSSDWAERGFCRQCGTHLFFRLKQGDHYAIPAGLIDNGQLWVFEQQIFIDEKPDFYDFANSTQNMTGQEVFEVFGTPPE
ncbi:GFA family protein [Halomonas sp. M20]|uniref:GFA family protein n=1 Tax=Halomonas sp. M20 TaxID=2763264 RepID=UPI001D09C1AA|nr:GFA family protein [Halomonas sp. M20]